ncbi:MAG: immunoglobulin-like domain-containing protein [bacterium]
MKKLLIALCSIGVLFSMTACGASEEDIADVANAKTRLYYDIFESAVASDFTLTTNCAFDVKATYKSSNEDVIEIVTTDGVTTGVVTRPAEDEENVKVTLTATLTKGDAKDTKDFEVEVAKMPSAEKVSIESTFNATSNYVNLCEGTIVVSTVVKYGFYVTNNAGLYVYVNSDAKHPSTLAAGDSITVVGQLATSAGRVQITMDSMSVVTTGQTVTNVPADIELSELNDLKSEQDSYGYFTIEGIVLVSEIGGYDTTRIVDAEGNTYITFHYHSTALSTLNTYENQLVEVNVYTYQMNSTVGMYILFNGVAADITVKDANPTIPEETQPEATVVTFEEFYSSAKGDYVTIEDVTIVAKSSEGTFVTDGTNTLYIRTLANQEVGSVVNATFTKDTYSSSVVGGNDATFEVVADGVASTVTPTDITIAGLNDLTANDASIITSYTVTGTLEYITSGSYTNLYLVDGDDSIVINYLNDATSLSVLADLEGQEVTINVFIFYITTAPVVNVFFYGTADDVVTA